MKHKFDIIKDVITSTPSVVAAAVHVRQTFSLPAYRTVSISSPFRSTRTKFGMPYAASQILSKAKEVALVMNSYPNVRILSSRTTISYNCLEN